MLLLPPIQTGSFLPLAAWSPSRRKFIPIRIRAPMVSIGGGGRSRPCPLTPDKKQMKEEIEEDYLRTLKRLLPYLVPLTFLPALSFYIGVCRRYASSLDESSCPMTAWLGISSILVRVSSVYVHGWKCFVSPCTQMVNPHSSSLGRFWQK